MATFKQGRLTPYSFTAVIEVRCSKCNSPLERVLGGLLHDRNGCQLEGKTFTVPTVDLTEVKK